MGEKKQKKLSSSITEVKRSWLHGAWYATTAGRALHEVGSPAGVAGLLLAVAASWPGCRARRAGAQVGAAGRHGARGAGERVGARVNGRLEPLACASA
jgi:hypothetical protein